MGYRVRRVTVHGAIVAALLALSSGPAAADSDCEEDPYAALGPRCAYASWDAGGRLHCDGQVTAGNCTGLVWQLCPSACDKCGAEAEDPVVCAGGSSRAAELDSDTCEDDPRGVVHDEDKGMTCGDLSGRCWDWDPDYNGCAGYIWQLCPRSCGECSRARREPADCSSLDGSHGFHGESAASWERWEDHEREGAVTFVIIYFSVWAVVLLSAGVGCSLAWCWACGARQRVLQDARAGKPVKPPEGCCLLFCCGAPAIYVWEGCSPQFFITCCLFSWFPLCCWAKTPYPLENNLMVLPPNQAGYAASVVGHMVQPFPAQSYVVGGAGVQVVGQPQFVGQAQVVGQPVVATPVAGKPAA